MDGSLNLVSAAEAPELVLQYPGAEWFIQVDGELTRGLLLALDEIRQTMRGDGISFIQANDDRQVYVGRRRLNGANTE